MPNYSEQDLKHAAEFRDEIHTQALARVKAVYPEADHVVDRYPAESYFQEVWDYPGQWYTIVGTPPGAGSRKNLIETIVRETIEHYRGAGNAYTDEEFYKLIAEYPDVVCDYRVIHPEKDALSHLYALERAAKELFDNGREWSYDLSAARCRRLKSKALFAPISSDEWLNYRRAFLHENAYTDSDFERVNAVLFPGGTDALEIYRWTTDWSEYFDEGNGCRGSLCLTVYDKSLDRFVVIMASATD